MTTAAGTRTKRLAPVAKRTIGGLVVVLVLLAMFFGTKIVPADSSLAQSSSGKFVAAEYGKSQFPKQQAYIKKHAVSVAVLEAAIAKDPAAAAKKYGKSSDGATYVIPIEFTGVVGQVPDAGFTPMTVQGLPQGTAIGLQLGPAITGTDLRDVTGNIHLGDFENQIQFQDAGSAINDQLKKQVLTKVDSTQLTGKTIAVKGAFTLVNPQQWNVTPASITVEG